MIEYTLRRFKRSRSLRITIKRDGSVLVTAPLRAPKYLIEKFVADKMLWIEEKIAQMKSLPKSSPSPLQKLGPADYKKHKDVALTLIAARVAHFAAIYKLAPAKISIKNQSTRWGSCSRRGNLNFNFRLLFLVPHLRDYVVVHEICHLKEMNHGPRFWALVARTFPDYKIIRAELRRQGMTLG